MCKFATGARRTICIPPPTTVTMVYVRIRTCEWCRWFSITARFLFFFVWDMNAIRVERVLRKLRVSQLYKLWSGHAIIHFLENCKKKKLYRNPWFTGWTARGPGSTRCGRASGEKTRTRFTTRPFWTKSIRVVCYNLVTIIPETSVPSTIMPVLWYVPYSRRVGIFTRWRYDFDRFQIHQSCSARGIV